ncbi:beta-lactamase [Legionella beliardensis]|uniref:Beta-lactamase n=1 Tax=Legionella beliardensis TaxID=91822 RepID=A0A378I0V1_9GAMM|nr:serine hydrolase [Legionella beliardensis]STX28818.1 beta-lactamase [Legionella beliardensis]
MTNTYKSSSRGDFHTIYQGKTVDQLIIDYMEQNNIPGMSLAIVQAPYITRVVGYGYADLDSGRLVATNTMFNIGQITHAFTAVAIMQLKEQGQLKLDDKVNQHLANIPPSWRTITIRHLLNHSSGLPDYTEAEDFDPARDYQPQDIIKLIKGSKLAFKAGAQMRPSATNFYLLGLIIEQASGTTFENFVTKHQIERMGLQHTYFLSNLNTIQNEITNKSTPFKHSLFLKKAAFINPTEPATGYSEQDNTLNAVLPASWAAVKADAGIYASAEDISLWDIGLAGNILVSAPEDRDFLYKSVILAKNLSSPSNASWLFPGHQGLMEIKGNVPGYSAFLSRFTAADELVCVTLLANKGNLPDLDILARKIAGAFDAKLASPQGAPWSEALQSPYSVNETIKRITKLIKKQGGKVFAHIDHAYEAKQAKQTLPPTEVLLIGNPAKGTSLMQENPALALDLPLRIMATQDDNGQVWLSFTEPLKLVMAYELPSKQMTLLQQMSHSLRQTCEKAVSSQSEF